MIEHNLCVPPDFQTSAKRRLRRAQDDGESDQRLRVLQLKNDYEEFCSTEVQKRFESHYTAERLESALREQLKVIKREQPDWFGRIPELTRREVAIGRLKSIIRESLDLPSFEHWSKQDLQQRLF